MFSKESNYPVRKGVKESVDGVRIFSLRNLTGNCVSWHLSSGSQEAMAHDDRGWVNIVLTHDLAEHVECRSLIEYLVFCSKGAKALEGRGKRVGMRTGRVNVDLSQE